MEPANVHERQLATARPWLGEEAWAAAWADGQGMAIEQAVCDTWADEEIPT
jgi:hypothetical protein